MPPSSDVTATKNISEPVSGKTLKPNTRIDVLQFIDGLFLFNKIDVYRMKCENFARNS